MRHYVVLALPSSADYWQGSRKDTIRQSAAHPAFARFLKSDIARDLGVPKSGKALVPGCGRVS